MKSGDRSAAIDPIRLYQSGLAAIHNGDLVHGREMLLEAVELDASLVEAWRELSNVLDEPKDQTLALQKYIALAPTDLQAQSRLQQLQDELTAPAPIPNEDDISFSPLQCVYCGDLTAEVDRKCPHCSRNLMILNKRKGYGWVERAFFLLAGLNAQVGIVLAAIPFMAAAPRTEIFQIIANFGIVRTLFTEFLAWPGELLPLLTGLGIVHALLILIPIGTMLVKTEWAYRISVVLIPLDIVLLLIGFLNDFVALPMLTLLGLAGGLQIVFAFLAIAGIASEHIREFTELRSSKYAPHELYALGHEFRKHGKWALATLAWQRAVVKESSARHYYQLGIGYSQLKRLKRARLALQEAQRLAPENTQIGEAVKLIDARRGEQRS